MGGNSHKGEGLVYKILGLELGSGTHIHILTNEYAKLQASPIRFG